MILDSLYCHVLFCKATFSKEGSEKNMENECGSARFKSVHTNTTTHENQTESQVATLQSLCKGDRDIYIYICMLQGLI